MTTVPTQKNICPNSLHTRTALPFNYTLILFALNASKVRPSWAKGTRHTFNFIIAVSLCQYKMSYKFITIILCEYRSL